MAKSSNAQKFEDKQKNIQNQVANGTVASTNKLPNDTYTVKFSSGDTYDLMSYNPNDRCPAARKITTRDFSQGKDAGGSPQTPAEQSAGLDLSGVKNKACKKIAELLITKNVNDQGDKLNLSQLIGILANIQAESGYSSSKAVIVEGTSDYAIGICQWTSGRATKMKKACGEDQWGNNLTGQVEFMWNELTNGYKSEVLTPMLNTVTDSTKKTAYEALRIFYLYIHDKTNGISDIDIADRKKIVDSLWKQIKMTSFQGSGKKYNLTEQQIRELVAGCKAEISDDKKAIQFEASLMCNLAYKNNKNVYNYVKTSGWFADDTKSAMKNRWRRVTPEQYKWGYEVFNGGLRTAATYIDEHDTFPGDIEWVKYNGPNDKAIYNGFGNIKKLIPGKSVLHNKYGSTYTFWTYFYCYTDKRGIKHYEPFGSKSHPIKFND